MAIVLNINQHLLHFQVKHQPTFMAILQERSAMLLRELPLQLLMNKVLLKGA